MVVELRIALLLIGLVVLVALYYLSSEAKRNMRSNKGNSFGLEANDFSDSSGPGQSSGVNTDNQIKEELSNLSDLIHEDSVAMPGTQKSAPKHQFSLPLDEEKQKLVVLHVAARRPHKFAGEDIVCITERLGLEYGDMRIFHKSFERLGDKKILYSIMNMVNPGTFELNAMHEFQTPGLSFAMSLPGPEEGLKAFDIMLEAAKEVADFLNGDLLDESRNRLSQQTITYLQEDIQLFDLQHPHHAAG